MAQAAAATLLNSVAAETAPNPPAAQAAVEQTPEQKEMAAMLAESGAIEYNHGPPGDQVKVTESKTYLSITFTKCNARQNDLKARGRKTLTKLATVETFLGSSGEIIGYDRSSLTVKVRLHLCHDLSSSSLPRPPSSPSSPLWRSSPIALNSTNVPVGADGTGWDGPCLACGSGRVFGGGALAR